MKTFFFERAYLAASVANSTVLAFSWVKDRALAEDVTSEMF